MTCVSCSRPLPAGARFCSFCGHEVGANSLEERRVVTVLFADLVGYTTLSEHLDPERLKRLVDGAFERLIAQIERFGGSVDKVLGDGILALFGAPIAHEDDPDRAVRAAMAMHRALERYVSSHDDLGRPFLLRIGVNTGEVVVGRTSGLDDYTAMGDVVNVASRLQSMAPPGEVYVGSSTAAELSPSIERVPVASTTVRGRDQAEQIWHVTGLADHPTRTVTRHDLPFVGRVRQSELFDSVTNLVVNGEGAVVAVSGEAGSGKTRLVEEALSRFPSPRVVVFSGTCAPYGETNVWAPMATALQKLIPAGADESPERLRAIVEEKGLELYGFDSSDPRLQRFVEGAAHLFGLPSELDEVAPGQAREILMQVVVEGVHRRSQGAPVVVWMDDLQWADSMLLELLARLARSLADRPVLLVTAQRDNAEIDWPPAQERPISLRMPLDPLTREQSERLVRSVLGEEVSPDLVDRLFERSGGNPLFLTQLAEVTRDRPGETKLPGSLRALIAARLDALSTSQRQVIDNAAVLGSTGPLAALEQFAQEMSQPFVPDDLDDLDRLGLLHIDDGWWGFRSDVVREVAYQTLTKSARAQRHAGVASVMRAGQVGPIDQWAHHAAAAAELVAEIGPVVGVDDGIAEIAVDLLTRSAERSLDVGAFAQAMHQASRALALLPTERDSPTETDPGTDLVVGTGTGEIAEAVLHLRLLRATAALERRRSGAAEEDARAVLEAAVAAGDVCREAIARRLVGVIAQQQGDIETARHELSRSVELLRSVDDRRELITSLSDRGFVEVFGGSLPEAERILAEAQQMAAEDDDRRQLAWIRQHQAWVAFLSGDTELAEERLVLSSGLFDDLGDRSGTGWAMGLLAYVHFFERRFADAEELATTVRRDAVELGELWGPAMMDALLASIRLWTGRFSEAEELSRRALGGFRDLNDRFGIVQALAPRMRALAALGRGQEAERTLEESMSMADTFGDLAIPTVAAAGTAGHLGLGARAVSLAEVAVHRARSMHSDGSEARIHLALGRCQVGDADGALAELIEVRSDTPYLRCVRALASAMSGMVDEAVVDADSVVADETSTYLDVVIAQVAAGGALLAVDVERGDERLERARATARGAGDAVAIALATTAHVRLGSGADVEPVDHLGEGWHTVISCLADVVAAQRGAVS
ncbi:ATP-binding protein [Ilumatobacter sp.]|uniref:ATP-binding protein n=1 Tax=Ilumatobacter sp. TaxID=1967498 RepID=UPI003B520C14